MSERLEGFEPLLAALRALPGVTRSHLSKAVRESSYSVVDRARALVPHNSGDLYRGISAVPPSTTGLVGRVQIDDPSLYYWRFLEFGTVRMHARPFIRPAAEAEAESFINRVRAVGPLLEHDVRQRTSSAPSGRGSASGGGLL